MVYLQPRRVGLLVEDGRRVRRGELAVAPDATEQDAQRRLARRQHAHVHEVDVRVGLRVEGAVDGLEVALEGGPPVRDTRTGPGLVSRKFARGRPTCEGHTYGPRAGESDIPCVGGQGR